jgi:hypothetical protein
VRKHIWRADIEARYEEIEEWDFRGGRSSATTGSFDDESNPRSGLGWSRLKRKPCFR